MVPSRPTARTGRGSRRTGSPGRAGPATTRSGTIAPGLAALIGPRRRRGARRRLRRGPGRRGCSASSATASPPPTPSPRWSRRRARRARPPTTRSRRPTALPFADARFPLVVAYNMLMDVEDLDGALAELRRVIRPDGRLVISIVHPLRDRGAARGRRPSSSARDWFAPIPLRRAATSATASRWTSPAGRGRSPAYVAALAAAGFAVDRRFASRGPIPARCPPHLADARRGADLPLDGRRAASRLTAPRADRRRSRG